MIRPIAIAGMFLVIASICSPVVAGTPRQLTRDGRIAFTPVFVASGAELVYVIQEKPGLMRLMRLTLKDGMAVPLHPMPAASELDPAYSPDGELYAYLKNTGALTMPLVIRQAKSGAEVIVKAAENTGYRNPAVAPDKSRILFCFAEKGRQQIFSVTPQGTDRKALTDSAGVNAWPSFSADGKEVVFTSSRDGNYEIYVMNADGSNQRRLTNSPRQDLRPAFAPDGKRIVFTSHRDGNAEIYLMDRDGGNLLRLTNHPERDDYPAWRPDGKGLVFVGERDGAYDLYWLDVPKR